MTRTFIALEMNEGMQRHLAGVIHQVAQALPEIRWVDPAGIHLTLAFLGELDDEQLVLAKQASEKAAQQVTAFSYRLTRLDVFGSQRQPRVIWMGIDEPSGLLQQLHRVLKRYLEQSGFEVDKRPFSPHLTLARLKAPLKAESQQRLQALLTGKQQGVTTSESYPARFIHVMKSELQRTGATYTCLQSYPLQ